MRKITAILLVCMMTALCFAGCGGSGEKSSYEPQTFALGDNWEVTITNDEVVYDDYNKCDTLLVYITAKNISDKPYAFNNTANFNAYQGEEGLDFGQVTDENDNYICNTTAANEETPAGESIDLIYGWQLTDTSDVTVNFGGFTVAVEDTDISFEVASRQTEEWKAALADAEKESAEKQANTDAVELDGCVVNVPDGWYIEEESSYRVKLKFDPDESGYVSVSVASNTDDAEQWQEKINQNYGGDNEKKNIEVNGVTFYGVIPLEDQVNFHADQKAQEKAVVEVSTMWVTLDRAMPVFEALEIK